MAPLELVSIDFLVDLPVTAKHNQHILVINDHFTKYIQLYAVKDRTAPTAAKCVVDYSLKRTEERPPNRQREPNRAKRKFPTAPLELVSIDFLVDLPVTAKHNQHILVINDHFTKYIQLYAVKDRTAPTAAKCVVDYSLKRTEERPPNRSSFNILDIEKRSAAY